MHMHDHWRLSHIWAQCVKKGQTLRLTLMLDRTRSQAHHASRLVATAFRLVGWMLVTQKDG